MVVFVVLFFSQSCSHFVFNPLLSAAVTVTHDDDLMKFSFGLVTSQRTLSM